MSFDRPTLADLDARIGADLEGRFPGADSRLRRSALGVLARSMTGAFHGLYGYIDYRARNILPDTAEGEWLQRHAGVWGVARKTAVAASGQAVAAGDNGVVIPAGSVLLRGDGVEYAVQADVTVAGGVASLTLAAEAAGAAGNALTGTKLGFAAPIEGVDAEVLVSAPGLAGGLDAEKDEALRSRLLARTRRAPEGGALADYERWAREVAGVTRVWVRPGWAGAGTVGITFVMDEREDPIPEEADLVAMAAHLAPLRPVTAELVVFAPIPVPLDLEIGSLTPDTEAVRGAIATELRDLLFRSAEPGSTVPLSQLREAISVASGEYDHVLVSPAANVAHEPAELAVLGEITWPDPP